MSLTCPIPRCQSDNAPTADTCQRCGTPLRAYARLRAHPARLFNEGLAAAGEGRIATARDRFAAIVHWCPHDAEARSALALACLLLSEPDEARRHWRLVLERRPADETALRGLAGLDAAQKPAEDAGPNASDASDEADGPDGPPGPSAALSQESPATPG